MIHNFVNQQRYIPQNMSSVFTRDYSHVQIIIFTFIEITYKEAHQSWSTSLEYRDAIMNPASYIPFLRKETVLIENRWSQNLSQNAQSGMFWLNFVEKCHFGTLLTFKLFFSYTIEFVSSWLFVEAPIWLYFKS